MARDVVGRLIRQSDFFLSQCRLVAALRVESETAAAGVHTAEEWGRLRELQTEPFGRGGNRYGSDEDYRRYLAAIHDSKLVPVQSLVRSFDFGRYRRILELGCGDMPQAFVICSHFPAVTYTATDFDPRVIEQCSGLQLLAGIRKRVFDVTRDDLDEMGSHDLVISWSLEFSLEDDQLIRLFAACRKHSLPYLLCTHTLIGPIGYLLRACAPGNRRNRVEAGRLRMIGWLRSIGEIARLARHGGMELRSRSYHVNHAALLFTPA